MCVCVCECLENGTEAFGLGSLDCQSGSSGRLENDTHAFLGFCRALEVLEGADALCHGQSLFRTDRQLLHLGQLGQRRRVGAQVDLVAHQNDGNVRAEVLHLGPPLLGDVVQRVRGVNAEGDQQHVGVRVGERTLQID